APGPGRRAGLAQAEPVPAGPVRAGRRALAAGSGRGRAGRDDRGQDGRGPGPRPPARDRVEDGHMSTPGIVGRFADAVTRKLGRQLGPDENFFDAGLDSVTLEALHGQVTVGAAGRYPITDLFAH